MKLVEEITYFIDHNGGLYLAFSTGDDRQWGSYDLNSRVSDAENNHNLCAFFAKKGYALASNVNVCCADKDRAKKLRRSLMHQAKRACVPIM